MSITHVRFDVEFGACLKEELHRNDEAILSSRIQRSKTVLFEQEGMNV